MPTYDYECPDCGHRFEAFQSMNAKPLRRCPACGKRRVKRLIGSGQAPIFKGSGFYQTDYKAKPAGGAEAKSSEPKPEPKVPETRPKKAAGKAE